MRHFDYLIIGQGIAGTVLSFTLLQKDRSVLVIDQPGLSASSKVAAGAFNPFNFRKLVNNWRAEELVDFAKTFYPALERETGKKLFHPRRVLKILTSEDERRGWENACREKTGLFAEADILPNPFGEAIDAPFDIGVVRDAGHIDTLELMAALREKLQAAEALVEEQFDAAKLSLTADGVVYDHRFSAGRCIFCEGHLARSDAWFGFLPIRPVKGQVLRLHIPGLALTDILNRGVYLLPLGNERFAAGATFENDRDDEITSAAAETELLEKLQKFVRLPITVESRLAGVRPAVKDRRPLLGRHPQHAQLAVFNGLGSKGVLLAPWLAERLVDYLEEGRPLPEEVDIERFVR